MIIIEIIENFQITFCTYKKFDSNIAGSGLLVLQYVLQMVTAITIIKNIYVVNPVLNGTWIEWNPVFSGKLS